MAQTHREAYPEQYAHPLVGKTVVVVTRGVERIRGTVERVFNTQFGPLATIANDDPEIAWAIRDCKVLP